MNIPEKIFKDISKTKEASALFNRNESSVKLGHCKQIQELQPEYNQVLQRLRGKLFWIWD